MHIPDGFIPLWQCAIYFLIITPFLYLSIRWANTEMDEKKIPILGVLGAAIFAIQALNIPIPWGTSGHMVGAAMAAIILGSPFAGVLLITLVLVVQALLFGDGGITALGVNIFNMGVVSSFVGFYSFKALKSIKIKAITKRYSGLTFAAFTAAWLSLFVSSIICAFELYFAGTFPLFEGIIFMGLYHTVIGLVGTIATYRSDIFAFDKEFKSKKAVVA